MSKFTDAYVHGVLPEDINIDSSSFLPLEAVYTYLRLGEPEAMKKLLFTIKSQSSSDIELNDPFFDTENTLYIMFSTYRSQDPIREKIAQAELHPEPLLETYFASIGADAVVATAPQKTYVWVLKSIMSSTWIRIAFTLPLLCPFLFKEGKYKSSPTYLKAAGLVEKGKFDDAWEVFAPAFVEAKKAQWLADIAKAFENTYETEINQIEQQIEKVHLSIDTYAAQIAKWYKEIESNTIRLNGMLTSTDKSEKFREFSEYLEQIGARIIDYANQQMTVEFYGTLDNYDCDIAEQYVTNSRSIIYSAVPTEHKKAVQAIYTKVFVAREYKLLTSCRVVFDMKNCQYNGRDPSTHIYSKDDIEYLPNPHIAGYNCFGGSKADILKALSKYDYYSAAFLVNGANRNLSFTDGTVLSRLSSELLSSSRDVKCFKKGDEYYSFGQLLAIEKEGKKKNGNNSEASE